VVHGAGEQQQTAQPPRHGGRDVPRRQRMPLFVARTALQVQGRFLRERLRGDETAPCAPKCFFLFVIETLQALVVGPISTDTEEYFVFILCSQVGVSTFFLKKIEVLMRNAFELFFLTTTAFEL
jgi:hypothetical protein